MTFPSSPEGSGLIERLKVLREFLYGAGPLDGLWFGDKKPFGARSNRMAAFWWRKHLDAIDQAASALSAYEAVVRAAQHAVSVGSRVSLKTERTEAFKALRAALEQSGEGLGAAVASRAGEGLRPFASVTHSHSEGED